VPGRTDGKRDWRRYRSLSIGIDLQIRCYGPLRRDTGWSAQKLAQHPDVDNDLLLAGFFQWAQAAIDFGRKLSSPTAPKPQPMQKASGGYDDNATTSPVLARFPCCGRSEMRIEHGAGGHGYDDYARSTRTRDPREARQAERSRNGCGMISACHGCRSTAGPSH